MIIDAHRNHNRRNTLPKPCTIVRKPECQAKHDNVRGETGELQCQTFRSVNPLRLGYDTALILTPFPMNTCARWPMSMSTACETYFCSQLRSKSRLLVIWSQNHAFAKAFFSSVIQSCGAFVMMNISRSSWPAADLRTLLTFSTICWISG